MQEPMALFSSPVLERLLLTLAETNSEPQLTRMMVSLYAFAA
jgi:hypothetical protein